MYSPKNKKVLGKMKDKAKGTPVSEYVGLRPKRHSVKDISKKAK